MPDAAGANDLPGPDPDLALLYAASGWIGLHLDAHHTHLTLIGPPTGLSLPKPRRSGDDASRSD